MNICFSARSSYGIVSPQIFSKLLEKNPDWKAGFIVDNEKDKTKILELNPGFQVFCLSSFVEEKWDNIVEDDLRKIEKRYECEPIWQYIYTDRFLIHREYSYVVKITVALFLFFEKVFLENDYQFYYDETIATLQSYIAYIVGRKTGTTYVGQMNFRKAETTSHYIFTDPFQHIYGFDDNYFDKKYPDTIVSKAEKYLSEFESSSGKSDIMAFVKSKPKLEPKWLFYAAYLFCQKEYRNPYDYMSYKYYKYFIERFSFYFRFLKEKKYYKQPTLENKYIYYPLHYQPEASTIVCAQKYEKQIFFIDSIAKSLPADTVLYVKEHYALLGHRELSFYQQLKNYPNVVLIDPFYSSMELIKKAYAVVTLTGTAGWEAMMLQKPVILGGSIYFDNAPGIIHMNDVYMNIVDALNSWEMPSREDILQYLCECFSNVHDGSAYFANAHFQKNENVEKIAEALYAFVSRK